MILNDISWPSRCEMFKKQIHNEALCNLKHYGISLHYTHTILFGFLCPLCLFKCPISQRLPPPLLGESESSRDCPTDRPTEREGNLSSPFPFDKEGRCRVDFDRALARSKHVPNSNSNPTDFPLIDPPKAQGGFKKTTSGERASIRNAFPPFILFLVLPCA